jgi:thioredoxin 1
MSAIEITADNFEGTVTKDGIVLLDFWAEWCGPCKRFAPVFEAAAEKHPDITWGKIDTEAQQELAGALRITSIPTLMVFRDAVLVFRQAGALPAQALEQLVEQVRKLDMDEVKKEIAAAKAEDAKDEASP